jgi:cell division protease FtsH
MDAIVEVLLEKETMSGDEFRDILARYASIPPDHLELVARQKQPDAELQLA